MFPVLFISEQDALMSTIGNQSFLPRAIAMKTPTFIAGLSLSLEHNVIKIRGAYLIRMIEHVQARQQYSKIFFLHQLHESDKILGRRCGFSQVL